MLEALRGLGYSTATALADLIDNSIAAGAKTVHLRFFWAGPASLIHILDDGNGMDADELDRAMRLGEHSPLETRAAHDLGRFGLGLKTALLSQCRRLTVASRKYGQLHCLRWDLDEIARRSDDGWYLLEGAAEGSAAYLRPLEEQERGTLVLWEALDRIITPGFGEQAFLDLIDRVEQHLAMVFHRYLQGPNPRMRILINEHAVAPWDPFLTDHPATWSSPPQRYPGGAGGVEVQGYVLPHRDRLESGDYERAGGPEGWTAQQGFYVYRNQRLLVAGGWLGLGQGRGWTREEAYRLARIRIDIPTAPMPSGKLTSANLRPGHRSNCAAGCSALPKTFASGRGAFLPTGGRLPKWVGGNRSLKRGGLNRAVRVCAIASVRIIRRFRAFWKRPGRCCPGLRPCYG